MLSWLLAGLFLGAWLLWFFFAEITVYEVSGEARLEVERTAHPVAALIPGRIISASLHLDQPVEKGDVLVELDASSEKLRLQEEESRLKALPPQITSLRKEIATQELAGHEDHQAALSGAQAARARHHEAIAAANFAKDHERRLSKLSGSGRVPLIDVLRVRAEAQKMRAAADAFSAEIRRVEMDARTRAHQKQAEVEQLKRTAATLQAQVFTTEATIARIRQDIEKHVIRSPVTGRVGDVGPLQEGSYVREGDKLGSIVPVGALRIVANFSPASVLGRIHSGQLSRMRLDGFPWVQYGMITAKVKRVATEIRDNRVRVEFTPESLTASSLLMQHGLPGSIEVDVERISPAVLTLRAAGQALSATTPQIVAAR
ncbi:MAG: HlyD family secretion protein [Gammaproteobacteria bacterium]